jgi:hypothetical protein
LVARAAERREFPAMSSFAVGRNVNGDFPHERLDDLPLTPIPESGRHAQFANGS